MKLKTLNKIRTIATKKVGKSKAPRVLIEMCVEFNMNVLMKCLRNNSKLKPSSLY